MRKICCLLLSTVILLSGCSQPAGTTWQEQYDLGVRYLSEGNYEEAIIAFAAAIEIDPKRPEAFVGRGQAYVLSGGTEEELSAALDDFEAALDLDDAQTAAWLGLADAYLGLGEPERAREALEQAAALLGEDDPEITDRLERLERLEEPEPEPDSGPVVTDVRFERREESSDRWGGVESAVVTGLHEDGNALWTYTTEQFPATELTQTEEIGIHGGLYYLNAGGAVTALDLRTGQPVWQNTGTGASISYAFCEDGTLLVCGYYGPDFHAISPTGETLVNIDSFDSDYWWPTRIEVSGSRAIVTMSMGPDDYHEDDYYHFYVDLHDWSYGLMR